MGYRFNLSLHRNSPSFKELELKWLLLRKGSHNQPFFVRKWLPLSKVVLKQFPKGGHPVDIKMAPLWSHFDFFLSVKACLADTMWNPTLSKFIPIGIGIPSLIPNLGWNSKLNTDSNWNSKLNSWSFGRVHWKVHGHILTHENASNRLKYTKTWPKCIQAASFHFYEDVMLSGGQFIVISIHMVKFE